MEIRSDAASGQGLHCLQIVWPFSLEIYIIQPDISKIEIELFQYIEWESLFRIKLVKRSSLYLQ